MKSIFKICIAFLVGMICLTVSCRMSFWGPHRLVTEPWFLEGGSLPSDRHDYYFFDPYTANENSIGMGSCILDDYLDAMIGLLLLPKICMSGGDPGEYGGWHIQRVLDDQGRWWRKVEATSVFDPVWLLYFLAYSFGLFYLFIGLVGLVLTRHRRRV